MVWATRPEPRFRAERAQVRYGIRTRFALMTVLVLAACNALTPTKTPIPPERPADIGADAPGAGTQSAQSADLERYYLAVQNDLLTRGLLRTDGGGPDTPFSADDLARNFETLTFYSEYSSAGSSPGSAGSLSRWSGPIRVSTEFAPRIPAAQQDGDRAVVNSYVRRLARVTRHPISISARSANFHVFVAGEDDQAFIQTRMRELIPDIKQKDINLFLNVPRSIYCLVVAFSGSGTPHDYTRAIALIRAEHPDLVRQACIHEEVAQGLGMPNDSLQARPSIFNDDDEFALLTNHDELLLQMLYDPRLKAGMTADEARPVVRILAREFTGQAL